MIFFLPTVKSRQKAVAFYLLFLYDIGENLLGGDKIVRPKILFADV